MNHSKLSFYQINAHHAKSVAIEINNQSIKSEQFMFLLQEPYTYKNQVKLIDRRKFNVFSYIGPEKIRSCILCSKNCEFMLLSHLCTGDIAVDLLKVKLQGSIRTIIIASCYMPSENDILPPSDEIRRLINYCKMNNLPLISGCDANSHHEAWGVALTATRKGIPY